MSLWGGGSDVNKIHGRMEEGEGKLMMVSSLSAGCGQMKHFHLE